APRAVVRTPRMRTHEGSSALPAYVDNGGACTGAGRRARGRRLTRVLVAQPLLADLAHRVARDLVDDLELLGDLLAGQADRPAVLADLDKGERVDTVGELHDRATALAGPWVRHADDRDVGDLWVAVQHVLHL